MKLKPFDPTMDPRRRAAEKRSGVRFYKSEKQKRFLLALAEENRLAWTHSTYRGEPVEFVD